MRDEMGILEKGEIKGEVNDEIGKEMVVC